MTVLKPRKPFSQCIFDAVISLKDIYVSPITISSEKKINHLTNFRSPWIFKVAKVTTGFIAPNRTSSVSNYFHNFFNFWFYWQNIYIFLKKRQVFLFYTLMKITHLNKVINNYYSDSNYEAYRQSFIDSLFNWEFSLTFLSKFFLEIRYQCVDKKYNQELHNEVKNEIYESRHGI